MTSPYFEKVETSDGWQVIFAFRASHRFAEDWLKMRWGFNASILLEEAIDRVKLFVETQVALEAEFRSGNLPNRALALRGINFPGHGLQMAVIGKITGERLEDVEQKAIHYARDIHSTFPHDFVLTAGDETDFHKLRGDDILCRDAEVAQILRAIVPFPSSHGYHYLTGLWQSSNRSNEQIWRALGAMPDETLFNIVLQPSTLFDGDRQIFLEVKNQIARSDKATEFSSVNITWADAYLKRRLSAWKKFFLLQIHVASAGPLDENLLRSIGVAITRDSNELHLPGYEVRKPDNSDDEKDWRKRILFLDLIPRSSRFDDLVDVEEASAIFRIPYQPETGLPGAVFIDAVQKPANLNENEV